MVEKGKNELQQRPKEELRALAKDNSKTVKEREEAAMALAGALKAEGAAEDLRHLPTELKGLIEDAPRAKAAKMVRQIVDMLAGVEGTRELQVALCKEQAEWARKEKRTFLRHRVEARLAALQLEGGEYRPCLSLLSGLLQEVRKLDDKLLLVDLHLVESKAHHALRNTPKAKAALTSARTAANAIYVPPSVQSQIDLQSGVLHAEEGDFTTGFSYFFEAFEQLHALGDTQGARRSLKCMLLCKVMAGQAEEVAPLASSRGGTQYQSRGIEAMKAVAEASTARSLELLDKSLAEYRDELSDDLVISSHLDSLHASLLERNLMRLVEPYSRVEIAHVARLIGLEPSRVERKLSQMILDGKLDGILDEGNGCLIIHDPASADKAYPAALEAFRNLGRVVDSLSAKSARQIRAY